MPEVFIGAGSNADPERRLRLALAELERRFGPVRSSSVYRGPAVGVPAPDYLNLVVAFETEHSVDSLRDALRAIEAQLGRTRADPRVVEIDLDVLLYGRRVDAERRLPRPGLVELPFMREPLAELAPQLVHPVTGERFAHQPTLRPPSTAMICPVT
ncbi:MAG TPA: 2-amino-4-hydroxy-6-hydroxymethyldihydropteridine diphosphokinase [Gammaproteobacteria bacterium]